MKKLNTSIYGMYILEPEIFKDNRGWFIESYSKIKLCELGLDTEFIQDNHSFSKLKGTIRGIHFQKYPKSQTKLIRCSRGTVIDVVIDLRLGSPSYLQVERIELSSTNFRQLYMPKGLAHAIISITDDSEIQYKVDEEFSPEHESGIRYDDPELSIDWGIETLILSEKDRKLPYLSEINKADLYQFQEK